MNFDAWYATHVTASAAVVNWALSLPALHKYIALPDRETRMLTFLCAACVDGICSVGSFVRMELESQSQLHPDEATGSSSVAQVV